MHFAVDGGTVTVPPKCGSSSVRMALFRKLYDVRERDEPEGYWVAVVRHPLSRLVSCYQHWIVDRFHHRMARQGLTERMPFPNFVKAVSEIPDEVADMHFKSQSAWIKGDPDMLCRTESLSEDWQNVRAHIPAGPIGRYNQTKHDSWESFYTADLKGLAISRYREDMERFYESDL